MDTLDSARDYTLEELADRWQVSTKTVRRWIDDGAFPGAYKVGLGRTSLIRIPGADVVAFEKARRLYRPASESVR